MIALPAKHDEQDDDDQQMDPQEVKRLVGELLGFDPDSVDRDTLEKEMHRALDDLSRRLKELGA